MASMTFGKRGLASRSAVVSVCLLFVLVSSGSAQRFDPKTLPLFTEGKVYMDKYETGYYPGSTNEMPKEHLAAGLRMAEMVRPRDKDGNIDEANGRVVGLVMGHSNTTLYFNAFQEHIKAHSDPVSDKFVLVVGSVAGNQLPEILRLQGPVWDKSARYIQRADCTANQVQVLFLHTTFNGPGSRDGNGPPPPPFPDSMQKMQRDVATVLAHCVKIYPNLRICYLTTDGLRQFSGMEPHVWREAFGIKWLIESQIKGEKGAEFEDKADQKRVLPWLCWGPYIWDPTWTREDTTDGVHPGPAKRQEVVEKYWKHLQADPVAQSWFWKPGVNKPPATAPAE